MAASFSGLEPGKSSRAKVDKVLGQPILKTEKGLICQHKGEGFKALKIVVHYSETTDLLKQLDIYFADPMSGRKSVRPSSLKSLRELYRERNSSSITKGQILPYTT